MTKLAKVPSWLKDMSLETYAKEMATGTDINEDIPKYVNSTETTIGVNLENGAILNMLRKMKTVKKYLTN